MVLILQAQSIRQQLRQKTDHACKLASLVSPLDVYDEKFLTLLRNRSVTWFSSSKRKSPREQQTQKTDHACKLAFLVSPLDACDDKLLTLLRNGSVEWLSSSQHQHLRQSHEPMDKVRRSIVRLSLKVVCFQSAIPFLTPQALPAIPKP